MTSTNDGNEVKNNLISGPKGKTYYIELYKSLESSLNESLPLPQRTVALCNAWRHLHSLCSHSAPSTHPHLLTWIQRHTATTVLLTEWRTESSLNERKLLENAINAFIAESNAAIAGRSDVQLPWEKQLVPRAEWFKKLSSDPWGHAVLLRILDQRGEQPNDEEVLEWLKEERGIVFVSRLRQLVASKCDDIALTLAVAVMERVRSTETPSLDDDDEQKPLVNSNKPQTFGDIMKSEAGFSSDIFELLIDIEFVLLDKLEKRKPFIDLAKQTPLKLCYQLAERLRTRLDILPKEKRLWKNAKHVATTIAQVSIARCMVRPRCVGASRACLYWSARVLARGVSRSALPAAAAVLAAPAASARHLHTFTAALHQECADDMKPFICELYIRAITAGMNELERLKLKTEKENETEARVQEALLASWFVSLGGVLSGSARIRAECDLTAFSLHPAPTNYERLRVSAPPPMLLQEKLEPKVESVSDFGSWANDSRAKTNFVKTSETLNWKINLQQINVVSTAILLEGEALGLSVELCQDLAVLLSGPRVKTFTWEMNRDELLANCKAHMERTGGGTKALTTELKYLNLDPSQFQHLPEESDGEDDIYYGIEKGYEKHLPEPEHDPQPEQIWADALSDHETQGGNESDTDEYDGKKKHKKHIFNSYDDDQDPLSLHTEVKQKDGHKKERQHSKERSKKPKAKKSTDPKDQSVESKAKKQEEKIKKDQLKKEKKEMKKREKLEKALALSAHSINELVGVKVDQYDKTVLEGNTVKPYKERKKRVDGSEKKEKKERKGKKRNNSTAVPTGDSQGITLMNSPEAGVVFDGLFSMDDLKTISPVKTVTESIVNRPLHNGPTTFKPVPPAKLKPPSTVTETQTSTSITCPEKKETKEEIKERIAKLLSFRKQRIEKISQHCENQRLNQQVYQGPTVSTASSTTNNFPQATTFTPEIKSTETQIPSQKVDSKPVLTDNLDANQSSPNICPYYSSPENKSVNSNQIQTNPAPLRVQYKNNNSIKKKNLRPESTQGMKEEYASTTKKKPVNKLANQPTIVNMSRTDHQIPNILQRPNTPKRKIPEQKETKHAIIGSQLPMQSTNSSLNQQKVISMKNFINEIQQSINAGIKSDPNISNLKLPQGEKFKQDAVFDSLLNVKVNHLIAANSSSGLAPQITKTLTKQIDVAPNTFSRLSYMHKNKLDAKQTHNEGKLMSEKEAISNELERHIAEFKLAKLQQQNLGSLVVQRSSKKTTDSNPVLARMLSISDNNTNIVIPKQSKAKKQTNPIGPGSNMDKELLSLLHQKSILNQTHYRPPTNHADIKYKLQGPSYDVTKNSNVTTVKRTTKPVITENKLQNNNHVLTSLEAHKATATVAKAPQSINKIAKPKKQRKAALNKISLLQPQIQKKNVQNVYNNKVDAILTTSFVTKDKLKDPSKCESEPQKQQNWESVLDQLLAHKTPSRGPNALNLALNKRKDKVTKNIVKSSASVQGPAMKSSVIANVPMKQTCNLHISHDKSLNIKKESCPSPKENSEIKILKIQNFPVDQFRKYACKKEKKLFDAKKFEKPINTTIKPGSKLFLKNTTKSPVNKQIDDEYALLEELIDRDLQQEIDELTSDEEPNMPSSDKVTKSLCKTNNKDIIKTLSSQNISVSKTNQAIYSNNKPTSCNKTIRMTNDHVNKNSTQLYREPNITVSTPSTYIPVQNIIPQTYTITNQTNSNVVINIPINLSNMLLANPSVPCESYAIVHDTYLLNSTPNVMLYQNSFPTPENNHAVYQDEVINKLASAESVEMIAAESLISMGMPRQAHVDDTPKVQEIYTKQNNHHPELHVNTAEDVLASEKFETSTSVLEEASERIEYPPINAQNSHQHDNLAQQKANQSIGIENLKEDTLSQTKENLRSAPIKQSESVIEMREKSYQKSTPKSDPRDVERLTTKRNNLINRVTHHKGLLEAIPLTYSSLPSKSNKENADTNIDKVISVENNSTSNEILPISKEEKRPQAFGKSDDLLKENKETKPCRRILLRSSNSLKASQTITSLKTTGKPAESTEKLNSDKIKGKRQRRSNIPNKTLKKSAQNKKKRNQTEKPPVLKDEQYQEIKPDSSSINQLDFEEALSTTIIPKIEEEFPSNNLSIADKSKTLLLASSEPDELSFKEPRNLETPDCVTRIFKKENEHEDTKQLSEEQEHNSGDVVSDPHDRLMQQNFTMKGVNLQVIRDIFDMDEDSSPISSQNISTNTPKCVTEQPKQTIPIIESRLDEALVTAKELGKNHSKLTADLLLSKEKIKSNNSEIKREIISTSLGTEEEFLKRINVSHVYTKKRGERLEKCVRVKLPNNKTFKVTVNGNSDLDIKTLLSNKDVKNIITSNWNEVKQFKLHVAHNKDNSKVLNAQEIRHCSETIDLLSDEDLEKPEEKNTMIFKTESGSFNIRSIDGTSHKKHQAKFAGKSFVKIMRHPISFFEKVASQQGSQLDAVVKTLTSLSTLAIITNEHHESNVLEKVSDQISKMTSLPDKHSETNANIERTDNLQEQNRKLDYENEKDVTEQDKNKDTERLSPKLACDINKFEKLAYEAHDNENQEEDVDVNSVSKIGESKENAELNVCSSCPPKGTDINYLQDFNEPDTVKTLPENIALKPINDCSVSKEDEHQEINMLDKVANKRRKKENAEINMNDDSSCVSKIDENQEKTNINKIEEGAYKSPEIENQVICSNDDVSSVSRIGENQNTFINKLEQVARKNRENEVRSISQTGNNQENIDTYKLGTAVSKFDKNQESGSNNGVSTVSNIVESKNTSEINEYSFNITNFHVLQDKNKPNTSKTIPKNIATKSNKNFNIFDGAGAQCDDISLSEPSKVEERVVSEIGLLVNYAKINEIGDESGENKTVHPIISDHEYQVDFDPEIISISDGDEHCEKLDNKVINANDTNKQNFLKRSEKINAITTEISASVIASTNVINKKEQSNKKTENVIDLVNSITESLHELSSKPVVCPAADAENVEKIPLPSIKLLDELNNEAVLKTDGPCSVENNNSKIDVASSPLLITDVIELDDSSNDTLDNIIPDISKILENKLYELKTDVSASTKFVIDDLKSMLLDDLGVMAKETPILNEPIVIEDLTSDDDKPFSIQVPKKSTKARKKVTNIRHLVKEARTRKCFVRLTRCDAKIPETILIDNDDDTDEAVLEVTTNEININIDESDDEMIYFDPEPALRSESPSILNSFWPNPITQTKIILSSVETLQIKESSDGKTSPVMEIYDELAGLKSMKSPVIISDVPLTCNAEWFETKRQIYDVRQSKSKESSLIHNVQTLSQLVLKLIPQMETFMTMKPKTKICRIRRLNPMKRKIDVWPIITSKRCKNAVNDDSPQDFVDQVSGKSIEKALTVSEKEETLSVQKISTLDVKFTETINDKYLAPDPTAVNDNRDVLNAILNKFSEKSIDGVQDNVSEQSIEKAVNISKIGEKRCYQEYLELNVKKTETAEENCPTLIEKDVSETLINNMDLVDATSKDLLSEKAINEVKPQHIEYYVSEQSIEKCVNISKMEEKQRDQKLLKLNLEITKTTKDKCLTLNQTDEFETLINNMEVVEATPNDHDLGKAIDEVQPQHIELHVQSMEKDIHMPEIKETQCGHKCLEFNIKITDTTEEKFITLEQPHLTDTLINNMDVIEAKPKDLLEESNNIILPQQYIQTAVTISEKDETQSDQDCCELNVKINETKEDFIKDGLEATPNKKNSETNTLESFDLDHYVPKRNNENAEEIASLNDKIKTQTLVDPAILKEIAFDNNIVKPVDQKNTTTYEYVNENHEQDEQHDIKENANTQPVIQINVNPSVIQIHCQTEWFETKSILSLDAKNTLKCFYDFPAKKSHEFDYTTDITTLEHNYYSVNPTTSQSRHYEEDDTNATVIIHENDSIITGINLSSELDTNTLSSRTDTPEVMIDGTFDVDSEHNLMCSENFLCQVDKLAEPRDNCYKIHQSTIRQDVVELMAIPKDNTKTVNPLIGLVNESIVQNANELVKSANKVVILKKVEPSKPASVDKIVKPTSAKDMIESNKLTRYSDIAENESAPDSSVCNIYETDKIIASDDASKSIQIEVSIDYDNEDDKTPLPSPCEERLNNSNDVENELKCSTPLSEDGVVIRGIEIEDPLIGKCYIFRPIGDSASETDSIRNNDSPVIDSEGFNLSSESVYEIVDEDSQNSTVDSTNSITLNNEEKEISPNEKSLMKTENPIEELHNIDYKVIPPKETYFKNAYKRKFGMGDIKIANKKYRKGKNIDTPKQASYADLNYSKEYKKLMDYVDTLSFSYSMPFHKDYIDAESAHQNWPIKGSVSSPLISDNTCMGENMLFVDTNDITTNKCSPAYQSLDEEMSQNIEYEIENSVEIQETNFKTGFGEGSGRVIQNFTKGGDQSKFSAATLSDVKQNQPILVSEDCKEFCKDCLLKYKSSETVNISKIYDHLNYLNLRRKVKMFFQKTHKELIDQVSYKKLKGNDNCSDMLRNVPGLYETDYLVPALNVPLIQVVQVGQPPVSAAAQNPLTCDPRVTQVTDATLSQCPVNSPENDESNIKAEYTELTNADLSMVQGLTKQVPSITQSPQEEVNLNLEQSSTPPIISNINSPNNGMQTNIDHPDIENSNNQVNMEFQSERKNDKLKDLSQENSNKEINMVCQSEKNDNEFGVVSPDNVLSSAFMSTTTTSTTNIAPQSISLNGSSDKTDQIAYAMNAAGITITSDANENSRPFVNVISQNVVRPETTVNVTANNCQKTQLNTLSLQQALAQILPSQLNQSITNNGNQQNAHNNVGPQVLHIVQGKNANGNNPQTILNASNTTQVLHIVQNKSGNSGTLANGTPTIQPNAFGGLSLVDGQSLQQGGNQLLHIVNAGGQKNSNGGQLLKRVNLLSNLTNVQGTNDQKMVQFLCKSADGKAIHLNAPHQRGMVLRLQPIENSQAKPPQDESATLNKGTRSIYEDNYTKYVQESNSNASEKPTTLPKFNQAFGKPDYQEGAAKEDEINNSSMLQLNSPDSECKSSENNISLDHVSHLGSSPLLLRKTCVPSSTQQNIAQQLKQTIGPMNIQTMHGGVIYTRQIPVNLGGGQTINLLTVPTTDLMDESGQKQIPQTTSANESNEDTPPTTSTDNKGQSAQQTQPLLTHMRIKLPMLSKAPQLVSGARVVRPSFFQIQRNIVGGANQQVYQQYVLTTAPSMGQQTIRLPQAQVAKQVKVSTGNQSSSESHLSSSTLEQLREFDMVLEQVKERSTVQPGTPNSLPNVQADVTDSPVSSVGESKQSIIYSIGNNQTVNVAYVTRKPSILTPTTCTFVRSPDSTAKDSSPTTHIIHSTNDSKSSDHQIKSKIASKSIKSRPSKPPVTSTASTVKVNPIPKPSIHRPMEDEQTTQRILYILAEYKEQVENSPDKDKPAPRRRAIPPTNPPGTSKRKRGGSRRSGCLSPVTGDDAGRTMGSEDSSCGTSQGDCTENNMETGSPQDSPRKAVRKLTFDQEVTLSSQTRPAPPRNVIVADGQTLTVARSSTPGKPGTTVLMPANYILPVSMVKGGQQIAIVTNRGPKLLTVGGSTGEAAATNALLLQRLIGSAAGLKPVLSRPGVRHVRLPTTALQAFNLSSSVASSTSTTSSSPGSVPTPELVQSQASSPWAERDSTKSENEHWNSQTASESQGYSYDTENASSRTVNDNRTVLDAIPDRYSPDMEAQRIFDKMFEVDTKNVDSHDESPRVSHGYDIQTDCDDRAYTQVVQRKDGSSHGVHRVTHISTAALRHKYAMLEHELKLQKSLSEECEDLGVDSPSASELFPEAELLFTSSPAAHDDHAAASHAVAGQALLSQPVAGRTRELVDQLAAEHLLAVRESGDQDLAEVELSVGGKDLRPGRIDEEEFARSHPNTTFHTEPTDDVTQVQPYTLSTGLKSRHITSTIFHSGAVPTTVLMSAPQSVIAQANQDNNSIPVKFSDIDNIINLPINHSSEGTLVKDDGLTRYDILSDRELHLSNTASAIVHASGTQVIKRVCCDDDEKRSFLMDETDIIAGNDAKMAVAGEDSTDAPLKPIGADVDDDRSSPERPELFWESNSASERSVKQLDYSSDSEKCCKSPSLDETNSTDSSGIGSHMRLDSVIKEARSRDRSGSVDGSSADDTVLPPLRTYPAKRSFHSEEERSLSGKTRAGENPDSLEVRRRSSVRGAVKRGCHCCNGSPTPSRKKPRKKPAMDFNSN